MEMLKVPLESAPVPQVSTSRVSLGVGEWDGSGGGTHGVDEAGDFGGGLAAGGEGAEESGDLEVGGLPARI